jgi:hypothetical protein
LTLAEDHGVKNLWPLFCGEERREEYKSVPITFSPIQSVSASSSSAPSASASTKQSFLSRIWGEDGFSFGDILDTLNPLQHLPIVSTLYRAFTGDAIAPAPRVLGDALFGGPIGAATGVVNAALKYLSGKDVGEYMLTLLPIPTQVEGDTVMLAFDATPSSSSTPTSVAQGASNSEIPEKKAVRTRATNQAQLVAAFDAYARNNRLLTTPQMQNRFGIRL